MYCPNCLKFINEANPEICPNCHRRFKKSRGISTGLFDLFKSKKGHDNYKFSYNEKSSIVQKSFNPKSKMVGIPVVRDNVSNHPADKQNLPNPPKDLQTIYFQSGKLFKILHGDPDHWYDARYLVSDGILYDLESIQDIKSIPTPNLSPSDSEMDGYGVTGNLDYVLRMKAGGFYNRSEKELCSALLWKSTELMIANKACEWSPKDYQRLITWHLELGMIEEAVRAEEFLKSNGLFEMDVREKISKNLNNIVIGKSLEFDNDLVAFHDYTSICCEECAKLNGRVYSISGKNKLFPPLPKSVKDHGNFHPGCSCTMTSYFGGDIYYRGKEVDAIKASTRPFIDDRTPEQIQKYINDVAERKEAEEFQIKKLEDKKEYACLREKLPDDTPKSFNAYRRIKNANSAGFQKLQKKAAEIGMKI